MTHRSAASSHLTLQVAHFDNVFQLLNSTHPPKLIQINPWLGPILQGMRAVHVPLDLQFAARIQQRDSCLGPRTRDEWMALGFAESSAQRHRHTAKKCVVA